MRYLFAFAFVFLASCDRETSSKDENKLIDSTRPAMSAAEALFARASAKVSHDLSDPESAKFRDLFQPKSGWPSPGFRTVCGEVNAKNQYGGYAGFISFVYSETDFPTTTAADKIATDPSKFNSQIKLPETKVDFHYWPGFISEVCQK